MFADFCKRNGMLVGSGVSRLGSVLLLCVIVFIVPQAQAVVYVDGSASGNNDGTTWTDAFEDMVTALAGTVDGEDMWVAEGTYVPANGDDESFYVTNNVMYGGFPSGGGAWGTRDPAANETIFDGNSKKYHIVEKSGNTTAIIDGFVFMDGTADQTGVDACGTALYVFGGNVIVSNCVFKNNVANQHGGAVWIDGANTPSPRFVNCTFSNNTAISDDGGAIYFEQGVGSPYIADCTFVTNFTGNSGDDRGGAIKCNDGGVLTIDNCIFRYNTSYDEGGCIAVEGDAGGMFLNVSDSEFYDNSGVRGGVIFFRARNNATSQTNVFNNCVFEANTVSGEGGVIKSEQGDGWDFINCSFTTNTAGNHGGALMLNVYNVGMQARFINCGFTNNIANNDDGGAIRMDNSVNMGPILVTNCTFNGNRAGTAADDRGGAIYADDGDTMIVIDCLFTNNTAGDEGGAIALQGDSGGTTLRAYNTKFYNNTGGNGGAVYTRSWDNGEAVVSNCWFVDNYASSWGGALRMENADDIKVVDCFFPTNYAASGGGHMYVYTRSGYTGIVANIDFTNGIANNDDGGAIEIANLAGQTWIITNCTFNDCRAGTATDDRGGAINAADGALLLIDDCAFTDCSAGDEGGAINIYGDSGGMKLDARNLTFTDCSGGNGGAVFVRAYDNGMHIITNCTFTGSYASSWGGAVRIENTDYFKLVDCAISDSTANGGAGHAYLQARNGTTGYVYNVTFTDGTANTDDAGAVMIPNSTGQNMVFTNCQFINSQCGPDTDDRGGVISIEDGNIITFRDCLFTNVTAGDEGGVISVYGDAGGAALHLYDCELYNSSGADRGGGLYLQAWDGGGDHIISNCTFRNLSSSGTGGGICIEGGSSLYVYNTDFSQCESSGNYGGGIYASAGSAKTTTVVNCTFHTNVSYSGGGAIYLSEGILNATNTIFYGNYASGNGDEIYGDAGDTLNIGYCNIDSSKIENVGTVNTGSGIINTNPLFYSESTGDYHLKSQYGRWNNGAFVFTDTEFSPCIDAGDPVASYTNEVAGNGSRINMGRYGNHSEASRTAFLPLEVFNVEVSALSSNSVTLVGQLLATNVTSDVYIFYGTSDGGTTKTWQASAVNLAQTVGFFTNTVSITPDRVYYWRCYASNSIYGDWSHSTDEFMTGDVTVQAPDATASEFGDTGLFSIRRSGASTNGSFTVYYTMSGTAVNGSDYSTLSGTAIFPEGVTNVDLTITPVQDVDLGETEETVILNITDTGLYVVGSPSHDTVVITNNPLKDVIYVDLDAGGDNNGTSWTHAYTSLTNALGIEADGKIFWIAEGTYQPGGAAANYIDIGAKTLYGGFVGTETNLNERNWTNNQVILERQVADQRIMHKSSDGTAVLDGLIIKDGSKTTGGSDGGALECTDGNMIIRNCTFTNNVADDLGGSLYLNSDGETHVISNTLFTGSSSTVNYGGAVYLENGDMNFWNCTFRDNTVSINGGAIWIDSNDKATPSFYDCTFINNTAPNQEGGAVYIENARVADWGTFLFQGCTFDSNSAGNADNEGGGCIYAAEGDFIIKVVDCLFTNNTANQEGGCIFIEGSDWGAVVELYDSQFYNNSATDGACVWQDSYNYNNKTIVSNCWFENNTASSEGGALYMINTDGFQIMDCNFPTNKATDYGGHIYTGVGDGKSGLVANCNFTNGIVLNNDGGAIYIQSRRNSGANIKVTNCVFNSNVAGTAGDDRGGAIYGIEMGSLYVDNCLFTNNVAGDEGGAICFDGGDYGPSMTLLNSQFYNNTGGNGGAVYHSGYNYGGHLVSNSVFRDNTVSGAGGAIHMSSADGFIIKDCSFPTNRATGQGGHFYGNVRDGYEGLFDNVTFENGISTDNDGGAVMMQSSRSTMALTFTNCTFKDCRAGTAGDDRGGAIYAEEGGILTVVDCLITNVTAGDEGGAICIYGGDFNMALHLLDTDIYNATAVRGGAVYTEGYDDDNGNVIISNNFFKSCSATSQGGAINCNDADGLEMYNNTFASCDSSGSQGGALYNSPGATDITIIQNNTFHTNTSSSGGGAIYNHEGTLNITNSIFYENYASGNGDAVYGDNGDTISIAYSNVDTNKIENIGTKSFGAGIINTNPLFVSAVSNDYHLKSEWGHYVNATSWVNDAETSQCVLQGNPNGPYSREPHHHGRRNNMGRYGNHPEASKELYLWIENKFMSNLQDTSATLTGELEATNAIPTATHIFYGTVNAGTNKTWQNEVINAATLEGTFSNTVSSLTASTKYFWRCYATNAIEEHWSTNVMEFFTSGSPEVTNGSATALFSSSARISGGLKVGGYADAWICWGTNDAGTISTSYWDNVVPMGTATQGIGFATTAGGLEANKTYWYRCYVTNGGGTDWSDSATQFEPVPSLDFDSYKMQITFTNFAGRGVLTNFPALVKFTTNNVNNYGGFLDTTNGYDLRFWTNDTQTGTALSYEIEAWEAGDVVGGFSPTDVSGCTLWLDAGVGVTVDGSGNVTNWSDQSGAGNHVTSSGANAPLLVSNELNSRNVIQFDGGDEYMLAATMPLGAGDDDYTYFAVWQTFDTSGAEVIMEQGAGSANRASFVKVNGNYGFSGEGNDWYTTPFSVNNWSVSDMKVDNSLGSNISLYHNNTEYSGTAGTPGNLNVDTDGFRVGSKLNNSEYLYGEIAELLIYTNALSAADRVSIRSYLDNKYNLNGDIADNSSYIWVKIPELTNNLSIWATWGDALYNSQETYTTNGEVWSENFAGVWHLKDDVLDSTSNDNDGTKANSTAASGMIGSGQFFDGDGYQINCGQDASVEMTSQLTMSAWMNCDTIDVWGSILGRGEDADYDFEFPTTTQMRLRVDGTASPNTSALSLNTWYYVVATFDSSGNPDQRIYINGVLNVSGGNRNDISLTANDFVIGGNGSSVRHHHGELDEARLSSVPRGSNWIWACWMNQGGTNHDSFVEYGPTIPLSDGIQNIGASGVTTTSAVFNATLFCPANGFDVYVHWSQTNHSTNFTWNNSANVGGWTNAAATNISHYVMNLETGTQYYYTFRITNATTNIWAEPIWDFISAEGDVSVVLPSINNSSGASGISGSGATLNGNVSSTGGEDPTVTVYWGDNDGGTTVGDWDTPISMGALGSGVFSTNVTTAASNKTYYYRTKAQNSAGTRWASFTEAWMVKPITTNKWHLTSLPVQWGASANNNLNSTLGTQLATGLDGGSNKDDSDNLWLQLGGSWVQYWLTSGNVWMSNATPANVVIDPGQGFWIKRLTTSAEANMIFTGQSHTNSTQISFTQDAWTVFSWPYSSQPQANWNFSGATTGWAWDSADNIIGEYNGSYFAIYLREGGTWCKRGTATPTTVRLEPGQAYYYYHRGGSALLWTAPDN